MNLEWLVTNIIMGQKLKAASFIEIWGGGLFLFCPIRQGMSLL